MTDAFCPPSQLPLFPIRGCILLPGGHLPLNVFEPRYLNMVDDAMRSDRFIGMIQPNGRGPKEQPLLERVGCAGVIASHKETDDGRYLLVLQGVMRFELAHEDSHQTPYRIGGADYRRFSDDLTPHPLTASIDREAFLALLRRFFGHAGLEADWDSLQQAPLSLIADKVAMAAPFDPAAKQTLLEAPDSAARIRTLTAMMRLSLDASGDLPGA